MKTNEVCHQLNMTKKIIDDYKEYGLISPKRNDNDYRNFSFGNIQYLCFIQILRNVDINIEEVKYILMIKYCSLIIL